MQQESDIMFSSNDTPAEEFRYWQMRSARIINLDDITHIEALENAVGHDPGDDQLSLQSGRNVQDQ